LKKFKKAQTSSKKLKQAQIRYSHLYGSKMVPKGSKSSFELLKFKKMFEPLWLKIYI
jgi:hypothetical protein